MNCPACQTPNRDHARFCRFCGIGFLPRCPFCNADLPLPAAFCDQCGRRISDSPSLRESDSVIRRFAGSTITDHAITQSPNHPITNLQSLISTDFAAKLTAARETRAMEGERRVVTMLFCDVKGSTEAASRFDPEEWAGIINGAFECMIAPVYHYEGTVARLMGDGLLAFFGAPIAHEDDPQRAVLAGLEILENIRAYKAGVSEQWGVEIDARVGINTGLVVVGAVGSDLQMEYSALGDAINIAARMEQTAQPGTVQISEETHKLIAPLFEFEDLGFVQVKGKDDPVHTYRPLRPKTSPGRLRGIEGLESPTIGREREIAILQTAVENLSEHGIGSLIFLTGEAGMGKSRLLREAHTTLHPSPITFHEVAPLSFEASQPYALFRSFLRQLTGIGEMDTHDEAHPKLERLADTLPAEVRGGVHGAFASVLGVEEEGETGQPVDGEAFKRQLFAAAREAVCVRFAEVPGVIVLDDLHWADPASLDLFNHLFPLVETVPILFLCATRPERETPVWQVKAKLEKDYPHRFTEIPVEPLTAENSNALVDHLLTVAELPAQVRSLILEKSEGNPFFLEEIIRTLIEDGHLVRDNGQDGADTHWRLAGEVETIEIPDNLQTLLAARLDRLTEDTRRVLQLASVIGRTFYYRVLKNISETLNGLDSQLATLQRTNMILEAARLPELEFMFRHALVQETAYQSILRKQRREFHRRVGEAMEQLFAARLDEYAPVLAMHFERAGEMTRAFAYFLRAGDVAYRLHAVREAISHYAQALAIIRREDDKKDHPGEEHRSADHADPATLRHLCLRLGRAYEMAGEYDEALAHYADLQAFAEAHQDRELELAALAARATVHSAPTEKFDREKSESLSQTALALAEDLGNHETQAKIYWNLMNMMGFSGEPQKSYEYGTKSLEIARKYDLKEQLAYTLNDFQRATLMRGEIDEAFRLKEEARALWLELGNRAMYADSLISGALLHLIRGNYSEVEAACLEGLKVSQEIGNLWGQSYSYYTLGYLYNDQSRFDRALEVMQKALNLVEPSGFAVPLVDSNAYTGLIYGYLGDFERGRAYAQKSLQCAKERLPAMASGPLAVLAILAYWQGNVAEMEAWLGDTSPVAQVHSFTSFLRFVGECYRQFARGTYEELIQLTEKALPYISPMGSMVFLSDIFRLNGEAYMALNRPVEARNCFERALESSPQSAHRTADILFSMSKLETRLGHPDAAKACLADALKHVDFVLQHIPEPGLKTSYLARQDIQAILNPASFEASLEESQ